jgi:hypothetical protein
MYLMDPWKGKVHLFETVIMIHGSRDDVLDPDGPKIYDNSSLLSGGFFYSPANFIESSCDIGIGRGTDHIHILLYYPAAVANLHIRQPMSSILSPSLNPSGDDLSLLLHNLEI